MTSPAESKRPTHGFTLTSQSSIRNPQVSLNTSTTESTATSVSIKKETPIAPKGGKATNAIVEAGQEHTGRWTREEHDAFLQALQQYGKEWKKVAAKVKTRTVVQTRTHAQKYFQKLQKGLANDKGDVEMGTVAEAKKILPIASARREQNSSAKKKRKGTSLLETAMSTQKRQSAAATQAAAQLMTQMSQVNTNNEEQAMVSPQTMEKQQAQYVRHQGGAFSNQGYAYNTAIGTNFAAPMNTSQIKIIAPRPEHTMKKNKFPEPSPAACGKRKAIELAAAQMLAGVAASSVLASAKTTPPPTINARQLKKTTLEQVNAIRMGTDSLQIINPENLGVRTEANQRSSIGKEPTTPWDCELEALVSEVNSKVKVEQAENIAASTASTTTDVEKDHYTRQPTVQTAKRSTLHTMVRKGMLLEVETLLKSINWGKENVLLALDSSGFSPLHSAVSLSGFRGNDSIAILMTRLLICAGASVMSVDTFGNSPLHWAARVGNAQVAEMLAIENCPLDLRNDMEETALHWAMRAGRVGLSTTRFLLASGARSALFTKYFKRPLDLGAEGFAGISQDAYPLDKDESSSTIVSVALVDPIARLQEQRQCRANFFSHSPQSRTLVLHHSECLDHLPKSETDWEAPDRISSIINALSRNDEISIRENEIQVSQEFDRASLEFLSRVHSAEYLTFVNNLSKELEKRHNEETEASVPSVVPFTPMVQRTVMREPTVKKGSHSDTSFSAGSLRAARRAAGAIKHAVDCVLVGRNRNAFCIVRPPGHHAGINGLLDGGESCGFCIFNNVAAGAMHALSDENPRPNCERCAIVDIDVHHGNGTEEIVKKCDNPGRLFFFSVHLYDNDKKKEKSNGFKFYPGTGDEDDVAHNVINVPIAPMWKERKTNHSPSMAENRHNTRNKLKQKVDAVNKSPSEENTIEMGENSGSPEENFDAEKKNDAHVTQQQHQNDGQRQAPHSFLYGTGREAYRQAIQQRLLPALRAFNPDLILISLGLDASGGDVGNARHYRNGKEAQGIDLTPDDYAWSTRKIMEVADICCQGRVVSILEGGYGSTPQNSAELDFPEEDEQSATSSKLDKSNISECALRHLQALIDPHNMERRFH